MGQAEAKANLRLNARELRNRATEPELILWRHLRNSQLGGFKFRRQIAIPPFVVDFLCPAKGLIVEVDGWTHAANTDASRDARLRMQGFKTLRFTNGDVMENIDGVTVRILEMLDSLPDRWPHPNPSPEGEGL